MILIQSQKQKKLYATVGHVIANQQLKHIVGGFDPIDPIICLPCKSGCGCPRCRGVGDDFNWPA